MCARVSSTVYLCASVGGCIKSSSRESAAKIIKMTQCITDGRPGAEYHTHTYTHTHTHTHTHEGCNNSSEVLFTNALI